MWADFNVSMASLFGQSARSGVSPAHLPLSTIAITYVARGEEVGGATNASDQDSAQKGGSCPTYRGSVQ